MPINIKFFNGIILSSRNRTSCKESDQIRCSGRLATKELLIYASNLAEGAIKSGDSYQRFAMELSIFMMLIFVFFSLFIYIGMDFGYKYIYESMNKLNKEISGLNQSIDETHKNEMIGYYSQLVNIQSCRFAQSDNSSILTL